MRLSFFVPFVICANYVCHKWLRAVSSFSYPTKIRLPTSLDSTNTTELCFVHNKDIVSVASHNNLTNRKFELTSRVVGFYPFPIAPPRGPVGWILKDVHQAIFVTETIFPDAEETIEFPNLASTKKTVRMDFMTKDGARHPVWSDEIVKWNVFFGSSIDGEVRIKWIGEKGDGLESELKLDRLIDYAKGYDCQMNLYCNNCRMFAARMERETIRLNLEGVDHQDTRRILAVADIRCAVRIMWAAILPALYPLGAILLLYEGCSMAH